MCGNSAYCWKTVLTSRLYGGVPDGVHAADQDLALVGLLEAGDHPQRRGLAAPGGPEQGEELALAHLEGDGVDRRQLAEALGDRPELDVVRRPRPVGTHARCLPPMTRDDKHAPDR